MCINCKIGCSPRTVKKVMPIRGIARQLEISRNTVKKLIKEKERLLYHRKNYPTKLDAFKEQCKEHLWTL